MLVKCVALKRVCEPKAVSIFMGSDAINVSLSHSFRMARFSNFYPLSSSLFAFDMVARKSMLQKRKAGKLMKHAPGQIEK